MATGDALQKRLNNGNLEPLHPQVAMVPAEGCDHRLIGLQGVFLNGTGDNPSRSLRHGILSWLTSFSLGLTGKGLQRKEYDMRN